jgi:hypothetical protein
MPRARAPKRVSGQLGKSAFVVVTPADTAIARRARVACGEPYGFGADEPPALSIPFTQHQPADARRRPGGILPAAPGTNQRQSVHRKDFSITNGLPFVRQTGRPHDPLTERSPDIFERCIPQRSCDAVGQHGNTWITVLHLLSLRMTSLAFVCRRASDSCSDPNFDESIPWFWGLAVYHSKVAVEPASAAVARTAVAAASSTSEAPITLLLQPALRTCGRFSVILRHSARFK